MFFFCVCVGNLWSLIDYPAEVSLRSFYFVLVHFLPWIGVTFGIHYNSCESKLITASSFAKEQHTNISEPPFLLGLGILHSKDSGESSLKSHWESQPHPCESLSLTRQRKNTTELNSDGGRTPRTFPTMQWGHGFWHSEYAGTSADNWALSLNTWWKDNIRSPLACMFYKLQLKKNTHGVNFVVPRIKSRAIQVERNFCVDNYW